MLYLYLLYAHYPNDPSSFILSHSEIPDAEVVFRLTGLMDNIEIQYENCLCLIDTEENYPSPAIMKRIIEIDEKVHI